VLAEGFEPYIRATTPSVEGAMRDQPEATPNVRESVPFFGVKDMAASLRFYVDVLGFRITNRWTPDDPKVIRWCWLKHGDASLMLQTFWRDGGPGGWPEGTLGQGVSVCLMCDDALEIRRETLARGLAPSRDAFVGNNLWVVGYTDPDGYEIDFESPTDVPEGTEHDPAVHG
jgi:catechol 2,3-dioxygenase-like lactoylglutathione lyase family enzyme